MVGNLFRFDIKIGFRAWDYPKKPTEGKIVVFDKM